jgi:pilus assembly protein CpaC
MEMGPKKYALTRSLFVASVISLILFGPLNPTDRLCFAQEDTLISSGRLAISKSQQSLQMIVSTSQYLTFPQPIPVATVQNDTAIQVQPTGRNEILVSAISTGVAQLDVKGEDGTVYNVRVVVTGDARELQAVLSQEFPSATLQVRPIQQAVIISGQVTVDAHVEQAVTIAEQYYPTVINRIEVVGVHTIMLQTQVMEVSRTKLREFGIDWSLNFGNDFITQTVSGPIAASAPDRVLSSVVGAGSETLKFGIVDNGNQFFGLMKLLRQNNLAKVMADPTVVAIDGRPASFNSGGEFPITVPAGQGLVGIEFKEYGTRIDFVAKVRGESRIYLEVRPTVSEIDPARTVTINGLSVPGVKSRFVETAVELKAGQTLALAGLLQMRTEAQSVGLPGLADIPYLGALFRANREVQNEVELLILVTPNFASPMDCHEVPSGGPGLNSNSPLDKELYFKGHIEVPNACGAQDGRGECVAPAQGGTTLYRNAYTQPGAQENNMMLRGMSPTTPNPALSANEANRNPVAPTSPVNTYSPAPPYSPAASRQMPVRR